MILIIDSDFNIKETTNHTFSGNTNILTVKQVSTECIIFYSIERRAFKSNLKTSEEILIRTEFMVRHGMDNVNIFKHIGEHISEKLRRLYFNLKRE